MNTTRYPVSEMRDARIHLWLMYIHPGADCGACPFPHLQPLPRISTMSLVVARKMERGAGLLER